MLGLQTPRGKYQRISCRILGPVLPDSGGAQMNRDAPRSRNSGRRGRWRSDRRRGNDTELFARTVRSGCQRLSGQNRGILLTCLYGPYGPPTTGPANAVSAHSIPAETCQSIPPSSQCNPAHRRSSYNRCSAPGIVRFCLNQQLSTPSMATRGPDLYLRCATRIDRRSVSREDN